jgi:hypothetical protein
MLAGNHLLVLQIPAPAGLLPHLEPVLKKRLACCHTTATLSCTLLDCTPVNVQEDCGLVVDFASFPALLLKLLNLLVEQPSTYLGLLVLRADGSAVLEFAQNLEFKAMSLLSMRVEAVQQVRISLHFVWAKQHRGMDQTQLRCWYG